MNERQPFLHTLKYLGRTDNINFNSQHPFSLTQIGLHGVKSYATPEISCSGTFTILHFIFFWSASESSSASGASSASSTVKKDTENGKKEVEVKQKIGEVSLTNERIVFF